MNAPTSPIVDHIDILEADPSIEISECSCGKPCRATCERCGKHLCQACAFTVFSAHFGDGRVCRGCLDDGELRP